MEISSLASGTNYPAPQSSESARKNADAFAIAKIQNQGSLVTGLLPALTRGSAQGANQGTGLGIDIYTAVGMQTQGMMSRGLMGTQIANISLGIDMSQAGKDAVEADPIAVTTDFSADQKAQEETTTRNYSNPGLLNPGLGGLLNSLG